LRRMAVAVRASGDAIGVDTSSAVAVSAMELST
jgi:hypothetical protein